MRGQVYFVGIIIIGNQGQAIATHCALRSSSLDPGWGQTKQIEARRVRLRLFGIVVKMETHHPIDTGEI